MKFNFLNFTFVIIIALSITSCDWLDSDTETTVSDNPRFRALTLNGVVSNAALSRAKFTLEQYSGTDSIIVNLDSLPYKTDISKVIPSFSFQSNYLAYAYLTDSLGVPKDTILLTGKDTLNFNRVYKIRNIASNKKNEVTYRIKVNVHTVETELYVWKRISNGLYDVNEGSVQKGVLLNDNILFYVGNGLNNWMYKSSNGMSWEAKKTITSLPNEASLNDIQKFKNKLFLIHEGEKLFSSTDGQSWSSTTFNTLNYTFINLLFEFNGKLWAIAKSKTDMKYRFANTSDAITWLIINEIPNNFPIGDFATLSFNSRNHKPKAIIAGGVSKEGKILNNVWSTEDGTYWVDFSRESNTFGYRAGASIIAYDNKLLMFGGMDENSNVNASSYLESYDEGLRWNTPDTINNKIRQRFIISLSADKSDTTYLNYEKRYRQTLLLDKNKNLILIGGRQKSKVFSDIWMGKLTRLGFAD